MIITANNTKTVAKILKERFPNLSVDETIDLTIKILSVIVIGE